MRFNGVGTNNIYSGRFMYSGAGSETNATSGNNNSSWSNNLYVIEDAGATKTMLNLASSGEIYATGGSLYCHHTSVRHIGDVSVCDLVIRGSSANVGLPLTDLQFVCYSQDLLTFVNIPNGSVFEIHAIS
jgi:hypothetical protein